MHLLTPLTLLAFMAPYVAAHGKVAVVRGNAGGNGTALGITGGNVPGTGSNSKTEVDTTVFDKTNITTNGLGHTTGNGQNKAADLKSAMVLSGNVLPQVSATNGSIIGTFHIVTTDGAGPVQAVIDSTATGNFSHGVLANVTTDVPGKKGFIEASGKVPRALQAFSLIKRADNVNKDFPFAVSVPSNTTCSGTIAGQSNICFMKIANSNNAGPFGGVIAFQIVGKTAAKGNATNDTARKFIG